MLQNLSYVKFNIILEIYLTKRNLFIKILFEILNFIFHAYHSERDKKRIMLFQDIESYEIEFCTLIIIIKYLNKFILEINIVQIYFELEFVCEVYLLTKCK